MPRKKIYLSGVVRFKNGLSMFLSGEHSHEEWRNMAGRAGEAVQQIEKILRENNAKPGDLPTPSKMAYYFIKEFHEGWQEKAGAGIEGGGVGVGKERKRAPDPDSRLQSIARETADKLNLNEGIIAEFYPFSWVKLTGRLRGDTYYIRVSHLLKDAPEEVIEAAVSTLIMKRLGRPSIHYKAIFNNYIKTNEMMRKVEEHRKDNARKELRGEKGRYYDLRDVFNRMNRDYFHGEIRDITLTWGRRSQRVLGHYDHAKRTIVVSTILDSARVPGYLVEYILYHEMLHHRLRSYYRDGRRVVHSREFKESERRFPKYEKAKQKIKELFGGIGSSTES